METSELICSANQLTGFYMRATLALNGLTIAAKLCILDIYGALAKFPLKLNSFCEFYNSDFCCNTLLVRPF